uniref:Reverse transcriptase domain-containing protein n=1 Tax=Meloidogyne incognita TaxID=6306 RepID=A0A914P206_MELIC
TYLQSASEHSMCARQATSVNLKIANVCVEITIHLFNDKFHWDNHDYHFILGCDAMVLLPPILIDFKNKNLRIEGSLLEIDNRLNRPLRNFKIYALETSEIGPNEQSIMKARADFSELLRHDIYVHAIENRLADQGLSLVPLVTKPKESIRIILSNPTGIVKRIYKDTCVAIASEVLKTDSENILSEIKLNEDSEEMNSLGKAGIIVDPTYKIDFEKTSVVGEDLKKLKDLCNEFEDIFSKSQYDIGSCTAGEHDIITTSEEPVASRPHRVPFKYRDELQKHIDQLLASGVMIESDTPWVSNIVLVQKKDGGLRPCIDFRKLNEVTVPDHFPLPRLETILEKVGNCRYYTSLDLASGYLQIKLSERASRKCGVITEDKIYQMVNLPFGLKNATSAFARIMAHVLTSLENVIAYVDDILIFTKSENFDEHIGSLRGVFERFRRFNLKLSPKKCTFASDHMEFLGFIVNKSGYSPSLRKTETILNLKNPTSVKEVRHVIGMANFFRKHVPNFSTIVEPLTRLTRKEKPFVWGEEQQQAFDECSRTLSNAERKWPPVQVELGAIIYSLRQFKPFIFMSSVELHTDHKPLAYLLRKSETHQHLARWLVELQNYNIKIVHISGKQNTLADALSRFSHEDLTPEEVEKIKELEDIAEFPVCLAIEHKPRVVHENFGLTLSLRSMGGEILQVDIRDEQKEDPEASILIEFLKTGRFPEELPESEKDNLAHLAKDLCLESDVLYLHHKDNKPRIYIPVSLRALIF